MVHRTEVLLDGGIEEAKRTGYYKYFKTDENNEFVGTLNPKKIYNSFLPVIFCII